MGENELGSLARPRKTGTHCLIDGCTCERMARRVCLHSSPLCQRYRVDGTRPDDFRREVVHMTMTHEVNAPAAGRARERSHA